MLNYSAYNNNNHGWRKLFFSIFVVLCFAVAAYSLSGYSVASNDDVVIVNVEETQAQEIKAEELIKEKESPTLFIEEEKTESVDDFFSPIERNKNPQTKLDEAKKYAKPQILSGKYIDVSLQYQNMVIFEDGKVVDAYQISSGKKGFESPIGTFKIENKAPKAWSKKYGLWLPSWMAILPSGKVGIHELPIWPGGYQEGASHLGTPVSHGCVRLGVGAAKRVYDWAEIGTPVIVHK